MHLKPISTAYFADLENADIKFVISCFVSSFGVSQVSSYGIGLGPTISQPSFSIVNLLLPSHGLFLDAFLPACANCIAGTELYFSMNTDEAYVIEPYPYPIQNQPHTGYLLR